MKTRPISEKLILTNVLSAYSEMNAGLRRQLNTRMPFNAKTLKLILDFQLPPKIQAQQIEQASSDNTNHHDNNDDDKHKRPKLFSGM